MKKSMLLKCLLKRYPLVSRWIFLPLALFVIFGFLFNAHILDTQRKSITVRSLRNNCCRMRFKIRFLSNHFSCSPKTNIVFLKTHKCAGSSIQNILMRYGDSHKLTFVLPKKGNYLGHPAPFSKTMVAPPRLRSYNILAHHTRLDYQEIQSIMPKDSVYITIVRDPIELFESAYSYYAFGSYLGGNLHKFISRIPTMNENLLHKRFKPKFGSNQMMFDLGADPEIFSNETLIKQYIDKLDSWFDLVLVADRMNESLVLLRHLMCWELDDVVTFKLNARDPKFKSNLNEMEKTVLRQLNRADVLLYNHFVQKFEKAIDAIGRDRVEMETQELRKRTQQWYNLCIKREQRHAKGTAKPKYYFNPKVIVFEPNINNNDTCKLMTMEELPYTDILRKKQQKLKKNATVVSIRKRLQSTLKIS